MKRGRVEDIGQLVIDADTDISQACALVQQAEDKLKETSAHLSDIDATLSENKVDILKYMQRERFSWLTVKDMVDECADLFCKRSKVVQELCYDRLHLDTCVEELEDLKQDLSHDLKVLLRGEESIDKSGEK